MTARRRSLTLVAAALYCALHLFFLPRTLEDIDSINFALGVESFDVAAHRPHPPGYPIFIAAAKLSTAVIGWIRPDWDRDHRAAAGLAVWGVLAATLAWFVLPRFWALVGARPREAWLATLVTLASPLFWVTANRPLSDVPGLVAALFVQVLLLNGIRRLRDDPRQHGVWLAGAFAAGLIIGVRSQTMWLTGPLLCWGAGVLIVRGQAWHVLTSVALAAVGALVWFIPLIWLTGGLGGYLQALGSQGAEDFAGVGMLYRTFSGHQLAVALRDTFLAPWQMDTLAHVVLGLALIGFVRLAWTDRRALALVLVGFLPYILFHLTFHETVTIRYSLPIVIPVVGLAIVGVSALGRTALPVVTSAIALVSVVLATPLLATYARDGAPVFRAFQDMQRAEAREVDKPVLRMHHQVWWGTRRVLDWYRSSWRSESLPFPGDREWLDVVEHFRTGGVRPVWFLGHLPRNDLAAFDPRTTIQEGRYVLDPRLRTLMGGARLDSVSRWTIRKPVWMLGAGWALTPELAGMTVQDRANGVIASTRAFLARAPVDMSLVVGGRYLGAEDGPDARIVASIDGQTVASWAAKPQARWFVQWIDVPAAIVSGPGPYAVLDLRVSTDSGRPVPPIGFEQFDAAASSDFIYALAEGWHEAEEDPSKGLFWRWTSRRSTIEVHNASGDRTLRMAGESPLKYFDGPPDVTVRAGDRVLSRFRPVADFEQDIPVPAAFLGDCDGVLTIETSRTFRPSDRGPSGDHRELGLRLYELQVR